MISAELHEVGLGGIGLYVNRLSRELVQRGHEVTILASTSDNNQLGRFDPEIHLIPLSRTPMVGMASWSCVAYNFTKKLTQRSNFDLVNPHFPLSFLYSCFYRLRVPMVVTVHIGWPTSNPRYPLHRKMYAFVRDLLTSANSNRIIVLNNDYLRRLSRFVPSDKIKYVPNAICWSEFAIDSLSNRFRRKFGISSDEILMLSLGRISRGKGIETLLKAMRIIQDSFRTCKIRLVIAGEGPLKPILMSRYTDIDNVIFAGYLPTRDDVLSAYRESDLFVFTSEGGEGMPTVLLEAMASGLPIISTRVPGATEIIKEDFGRLVDRNNPTQLAKTILELTSDKSALEKMGLNASNYAKRYDWSEIIPRILEVFESVR